MKQQKLTDYTPKFPRKAWKGAMLTAAAAITLGTAGGCVLAGVPMVQEPVELDGAIAIDEPIDEPVRTDGEIAIDEPEDDPMLAGEPMPDETDAQSGREGPALEGKIIVPDDEP